MHVVLHVFTFSLVFKRKIKVGNLHLIVSEDDVFKKAWLLSAQEMYCWAVT